MWLPLSSLGQPADVRADSERRTDGLQSASLSHGWMGCRWIWPDSEHAAMEMRSLRGPTGQDGLVRMSQSCGKYKVYLCTSLYSTTEATKKKQNWSPFPSRTSLQNMCISLIPRPFSLSLFLSIVWVNWESNRITAWQFLPVVWFLITTFIFLFWEKNINKDKEIAVPNKNYIDISGKLQDQLHKLLLYHCIITRF